MIAILHQQINQRDAKRQMFFRYFKMTPLPLPALPFTKCPSCFLHLLICDIVGVPLFALSKCHQVINFQKSNNQNQREKSNDSL